jgi:hypothetical protein
VAVPTHETVWLFSKRDISIKDVIYVTLSLCNCTVGSFASARRCIAFRTASRFVTYIPSRSSTAALISRVVPILAAVATSNNGVFMLGAFVRDSWSHLLFRSIHAGAFIDPLISSGTVTAVPLFGHTKSGPTLMDAGTLTGAVMQVSENVCPSAGSPDVAYSCA